MQPKRGPLAGTIIETGLPENNFILIDLDNNHWEIETGEVIWKGGMTPATGLKIKLIGTLTYDNNFKAMEIRPRQGKGRFMIRSNNQ